MSKKNAKPKIAVVGDIILDKYSYGKVERISPEAPIQILNVKNEEFKPGGAGNTAANLTTLGAEVDLFGVVGDDHSKDILLKELKRFKINSKIIVDKQRPTIVKQRAIAQHQQLIRIDYETNDNLKDHHIKEIKESFNKSNKYDAIIISDYQKGMVTKELVDYLKSTSIPVFVDTKTKDKDMYKGVFAITPNITECTLMMNMSSSDDLKAAERMSKDLDTNVLLTRSEKGIALFKKGKKKPELFETVAKDIADVTGAGDTVVATFVFFYALGENLEVCTELANKAAGISVSKIGCYQVKVDEIMEGEKEE